MERLQHGANPIFSNEPFISSLSLMTSLGCNLQCEYCVINHARKFNPKKAAEKQKATIEALKDGSFYDNAVKSLIAYGGSPNDIRKIELWGQEQILTLDYFIDGLDKWVEAFRNWSELSFSTNGQAGPEKIVRLITEIDKRMNHDFRFSLQWSYDGTYSSKYLRGDTDIKVLENFKKVLTALNDVRLDHVEVEFYVHGVVSFSLIRELNGDLEKIKEYWDGCRKVCAELPKYCWNRSVICYPDYSIAEEVPYRCSKSEGLDYYDFLNKSLACGGDVSGLEFLSGQWNRIMRISFDNMRSCTLDEMVDWLVEIPSQTLERMDYVTRKMTNGFFCGGGTGELKMLYDGTLVSCQNSIFETELDCIEDDNTIENQAKRVWVEKGWFVNPITDSKEDVERYKYMFTTGRRSTFWHTWNTTLTKMYYLAECGQIHPSYRDNLKKIIKHSYMMTYMNQCFYNNYVYTGSSWSKDTGVLRRYCNGFSDYSEELENNANRNCEFRRGGKFYD
jgi:pyruvate-formate lyase-activating enzyme